VARDRYVAEDALELIQVDYEPLDPVLDAEAAAATDACVHERSFAYGDVDAAVARADLVVRERFRFPRWSCTPVECYGVVCDWDEASGTLTAWANFQGPFTLHSVAAAALAPARLEAAPDHAARLGRLLRDQVLRVRLRSPGWPSRPPLRRPGPLDGGSAGAPRGERSFGRSASPSWRPVSRADGELLALRYDAIEDVGAYVRAPEPATLYRMHGRSAARTACGTSRRETASC
jgi:2-furoyl-CoA dehydrogenase large subunit